MKRKILGALLTSLLLAPAISQAKIPIPPNIPNRLLILPSDPIKYPENWQNVSARIPKNAMTPLESVNWQAEIPGRLVLVPGNARELGDLSFHKKSIDIASKNKRFEYAYIYDELFWTGKNNQIGLYENEVLNLSSYAKSRGMKPIVTFIPTVVLDPQFKLQNINAFDVIALDPYPLFNDLNKIGLDQVPGCKYGDGSNILSNILYCSSQKLKQMGFRGKLWYLYEGFGSSTLSNEEQIKLSNNFKVQQQQTIRDADKMGFDGISPYGIYLGSQEIRSEPFLVEGASSNFADLVNFENIPWAKLPGNATTYNFSLGSPDVESGKITIGTNNGVAGIYTEKVCMYGGNVYKYDLKTSSCLYSDGKWYPTTTPGVSLASYSYSISGLVDNNGRLQANWVQSSNNLVRGTLIGTPGLQGTIKLQINLVNGVKDAVAQTAALVQPLSSTSFPAVEQAQYGTNSLQSVELLTPSTINKEGLYIWIHGGGWLQGDKSDDTAGLQSILRSGVAVLNVNYRLGPGSFPLNVEDIQKILYLVENGADTCKDCTNPNLWNRAKGYASKGFMIAGGSAGGHLSLMGSIKHLSQYSTSNLKCVGSVGGPVDVRNYPIYETDAQNFIYKYLGGNLSNLGQMSPAVIFESNPSIARRAKWFFDYNLQDQLINYNDSLGLPNSLIKNGTSVFHKTIDTVGNPPGGHNVTAATGDLKYHQFTECFGMTSATPSSYIAPISNWYGISNRARSYSYSVTEYPKANYGTIKVNKDGSFTGTHTVKNCMYGGKNYNYDGIGSCLYSDGKWYPTTTPGVSVISTDYAISGQGDAKGNLYGKWKDPVGVSDIFNAVPKNGTYLLTIKVGNSYYNPVAK